MKQGLCNFYPAMSPSSGFTLMEVLVATALTGIALGVLLSGFAQGHRQAFRGDMARKAADAARVVLYGFTNNSEGFPESDSGDIKGFEGWTYRLESKKLMLDISSKNKIMTDGRTMQEGKTGVEVPELREINLGIIPPGGSHPFVLTLWVDAAEN